MKLSHTLIFAFAVAFACFCLPSVSAGEEASGQAVQSAVDPELTEDLAYIKALVEANMPDIAAHVIAAAKKKWPNAGPKLKVLELQGDLRLGKFDVVQKEIDALKGKKGRETEYWALRLSMADAYYALGKMSECRSIYYEFFKSVTRPGGDLLDLYVENGFRWAQVCAHEKRYEEAVGVFRNLLATLSDKDSRWGNMALEAVELLLRLADGIPADTKDKAAKAKRSEYLYLTTKWVDKLLWKRDQALVFGKAIAMKAHIEMLRGKPDEAQALVNNYLPQLSEIHRTLMEADPDGTKGYVRASPMPECRYLLAKMLWDVVRDEAEKPKANESLIKDSIFGVRSRDGKRNGLGAYNHALNVALRGTDSAWAADAADLAEEIEAFVKDRYKKDIRPKDIPPELVENLRKMRGKTTYRLAGQAYKDGNWAKAIEYFKRFSEEDPHASNIASVYCLLAVCNEKLGNADEQMKWLREYVKVENKVGPRTTAQLSLALMQQKHGFAAFEAAGKANGVAAAEAMCKDAYRGVAGAIRDFRSVADALTKTLDAEGKLLDAKERELYLLRREQAIVLEAASWQRLVWPEAKVSVFRAQAVKAYERYLFLYPKGQYAPQAYERIAAIHKEEKNADKAQEALDRLQKDFPESPEAKRARRR